jgi:polyferredoxin
VINRPATRGHAFDLLRLPGIRTLVNWRYARLILQIPLLLLALLSVYDGLTGSPLAGLNVATVSVWVHYRGVTALVLALFGNLFCAGCPLLLTRGPSRWLRRALPQLSWPRFLRNKYLTLGLTVAFLFCYEAFALWSSPWLTAWLIIGYFVAALLTDSLFPAGTFCRYVCPLGNFNFALSGASPTIIQARDPSVCASCAGKYCVNGRETTVEGTLDLTGLQTLPMLQTAPLAAEVTQGTFPGCETRLYVPTITGNQDCTLCLNCVRACPHDNVALVVRNPLRQALTERPRPDLALLLTVLAWSGLINAFAMTPSSFLLAQWLSVVLHTRNAPLLLALILLGGLGLGTGLSLLVARLGRTSLRQTAPLMVPLALALWGGHYLYHFLLGASTLWPAVAHALIRLGIPLPLPSAPTIPRADQTFWLQLALCEVALGGTVWATIQRFRIMIDPSTTGPRMVPNAGPSVMLALLYTALSIWIFAQPMQARIGLLT